MSTRVGGFDDLRKTLRDFPKGVQKQVGKANLQSGYDIQRTASQAAPKDTGFLSQNIGVHASGDLLAVKVATGMQTQAPELIGLSHAGGGPLDVKYAEWVHDGTKSEDGTTRMAGRPYLAQAAASREGAHKRRMKAAFSKAIKEV